MPTAYLDRLEQQNALLDEWVAVRAEINRAEARAAALLAQRAVLMDQDADEQPVHREAIWRSTVAEFAAAGHIAKGTAERHFTDARWLATDDYTPLRDSFEAGKITTAHVREILLAASPVHDAIHAGTLSPETLDLYQVAAVVFAESEAPARTRAHAREVAAALAGLTINEQHQRARQERTVTVKSLGDGMALLQILLPEHLALAILDRLTQMARHQKQHPDDREPTLPLDDDTITEILNGDPHHYDPDNDADADEDPHSTDPDDLATTATADRAGETQGTERIAPQDQPADSDRTAGTADDTHTIFGDSDTFTRDPFNSEGDFTDHDYGDYAPPDEDRFHDDPGGYWDWVEEMISTGPEIIQIPSDTRTMDQIRTDLLTDLLLTADPSPIHSTGLSNITATIQVTIAATTLTGADDQPAQIDGHGELHPDIARHLAGMNNGWTRLFLDPTGMVTQTDTYTPTAGMKRFLRARDQHCRFPGCRMPVHRAEIDHTHDHALGGPTAIDNLAHLCKTHHALKHPDIPDEHRWVPTQQPNWDLTWTSPNGRTYTDTPPRRVMFVPSALTNGGSGGANGNTTGSNADDSRGSNGSDSSGNDSSRPHGNGTNGESRTSPTQATLTADRYAWHTPTPGESPGSDAPF